MSSDLSPVEVQALLRVVAAAMTDASDYLAAHLATCGDVMLDQAHLNAGRLVLEHLTAAQRGLSRITEAR